MGLDEKLAATITMRGEARGYRIVGNGRERSGAHASEAVREAGGGGRVGPLELREHVERRVLLREHVDHRAAVAHLRRARRELRPHSTPYDIS